MKLIMKSDAGRLAASMKRRTARLRQTSLGDALLRPSLRASTTVSPTRRPNLVRDASQPIIQSALLSRPIASVMRAVASVPLASRRVSPPMVPATTRAPKRASLSSSPSPSRLQVSAPFARSTRPAAPQQATRSNHTSQRSNTVTGPVAPGAASRMPPLSAIARASTARHSPFGGSATRLAPSRAAGGRGASPPARNGQRSRPASALAGQTRPRAEQHRPLTPSTVSSRSLGHPISRSSSRVAGNTNRSEAGGGDGGSLVLSGDFVVDGRRLGELALASATRGSNSAQTGARNPNFRRTALPSGIAAPLP